MEGDDLIRGGAGRDAIFGDDYSGSSIGNDILEGGGGNDLFREAGGLDVIRGGEGVDVVQVSQGTSVIINNAQISINGIALVHEGIEFFDVSGTSSDDTINASNWTDGSTFGFGRKGDDWIHGGPGNDFLFGDESLADAGNDVLIGGGGTDQLWGFAGDDRLEVLDASFELVRGDSGYDKLLITGAGSDLDLVARNKVSGIEEIDITGSGNNSLIIDYDRVLSSSDAGVLIVRGDRGDRVQKGAGWTFAGTEVTSGEWFKIYTQEAATLKILTLADMELAPAAIAENAAIDAVVGSLNSIDIDPNNTFSYSLVSGAGDTDNSAFAIDGNQLRVKISLDYETKSIYSIRVRGTDQDGVTNEEVFAVTVTDVNESPLLTRAQGALSGNVLSTFSNSGTWSDPEGNPVTLSASMGTVTRNGDGTWSWSIVPTQAYNNQTVTITASDGNSSSQIAFTMDALVAVTNARIYYRGSSFANTSVNAALDTSKILAKSGSIAQTLTYANLINTTRGINGLVFDVAGLATTSLTTADLAFRVSPTGAFNEAANPPSNWFAAPAPTIIHVTAGTSAIPARVRLEWADNAISNRWLQVKFLANANTGLTSAQVYYIGHLYGEVSGTSTGGAFAISIADATAIRPSVGYSATVSNPFDLDKSGAISIGDITGMRPRVGIASLRAITIPPSGSADEGEGSQRVVNPATPVDTFPRTEAHGVGHVLQGTQVRLRMTDDVFLVPLPIGDPHRVADATPGLFSTSNRHEHDNPTSSPDMLTLDAYFQRLGQNRSRVRWHR